MPLITCRDCYQSISDASSACIHCGCPTDASIAVAKSAGGLSGPPSDGFATARVIHKAPSHTWPGKLFIGLNYFGAAMFGIVAPIVMLLAAADSLNEFGLTEALVLAIAFVLLAGLPFLMARGVSRFRKWAWWICMVVVPLSILGALATMVDPAEPSETRIAALLTLGFNALWLHYFWTRRRDFHPGSETTKRGLTGSETAGVH